MAWKLARCTDKNSVLFELIARNLAETPLCAACLVGGVRSTHAARPRSKAPGGTFDVMFRPWTALGALLILAMSGVAARAHSFDVGFAAPLSGARALDGKQALDGFLLATAEQDGHAGQTSDGHLGGLDSNVLTIDAGEGIDALQRRLGELLRQRKLVFVTGILAAEWRASVLAALAPTRVIIVDPIGSQVFRNAAADPGRVTTMDGRAFVGVFRTAYGYPPNEHALRGYIAARLIAAAIRAEGGVTSSEALRGAVDRARDRARLD